VILLISFFVVSFEIFLFMDLGNCFHLFLEFGCFCHQGFVFQNILFKPIALMCFMHLDT